MAKVLQRSQTTAREVTILISTVELSASRSASRRRVKNVCPVSIGSADRGTKTAKVLVPILTTFSAGPKANLRFPWRGFSGECNSIPLNQTRAWSPGVVSSNWKRASL